MNFIEDDHRSSSADSFSLVENQNKADDANGGDNHESGQLVNSHHNKEESAKSTMKEPSIVEVAQVSYNDYVIRIFTDIHSPEKNGRCFYFEPVVFIDPTSIVSESNDLLKQDLVRFKIKMWDAVIRAKVLNRLRSVPSLKNVDIQEEDVRVMPYKEVQLIANPDSVHKSIQLANKPFSYRRLNENLEFVLECDTPSFADSLAENFKKNPELIVNKWELALECRGLGLGNGSGSLEMTSSKKIEKPHPIWIFNISSLPCGIIEGSPIDSLLPRLDAHDNEIKDLKVMFESANSLSIKTNQDLEEVIMAGNILSKETNTKIQELHDQIKAVSSNKPSTCVPVFSVENCTNPSAESGESFGFSTFVMEERKDHGDFDLSSGIYTVKTAGIYQLNFNAHVNIDSGHRWHRFDLMVNVKTVATSYNYSETSGHQSVVISALLPLVEGDVVGIFAEAGELFQDEFFKTRFFGILLLDPSTDE